MRWNLPLAALLVAVAGSAGATSPTKPNCHSVDADGDGVVTREEAQAIPRLAGQFDSADANKDGQLDATEVETYRATIRAEARAKAQERWTAADHDGDGALSREEAQASMPHMAEDFDSFDANGDGRIERSEMHNFRVRSRKHRWLNSE